MVDRPCHEIAISIEDDAWHNAGVASEATITHVITTALKFLKFPRPLEISILLTNNQHIQGLNKTYRNQDKPTNVLSFPSLTAEDLLIPSLKEEELLLLGDIVLAYEKIVQEAREQNKDFSDHLAHLTVHGLLHLLGYDHEVDDEAEAMEALEIQILKELEITNPYQETMD